MVAPEVLLGLYETMLKIRYFEERVAEVYARGLMPGLAHLYTGQEAVAAGVCAALDPGDYITSTHRGHGHCIAKGGDMRLMMAEIFGRATGYCRGKGGSMHIADPSLGILGANGVVGGGIPIAVGAALAIKMSGWGKVVVCFFGDDASNQGSFHEAANLAGLWKLPVVFVVENNLYGISVHQSRHQPITDIATRAASYGFPGVVVDGNDVIAVFEAASPAVAAARSGEGPVLLECKTYRWRGHHEGDPQQGILYRSREEIQEWMERCPIKRLETHLLGAGYITEEEIKRVKERVARLVDEAQEYAENSPWPEVREALEDVYAAGVR